MTTVPVPSGWAFARLPVALGARPPGTVDLADLATPAGAGPVRRRVRTSGGGTRAAALAPVHLALAVVGDLLIGPLVLDRIALDVEADDIGAVLDEDGDVVALWSRGCARAAAPEPAAAVGAAAWRLLEPVAASARAEGRLGARGVRAIVMDGIVGACERLERTCGREGSGTADGLLVGAAPDGFRRGRQLSVRPDAGPPVTLRVPRTCCVLSDAPHDDACPTCPRHQDDATRRRLAEEWLRELDEPDFRWTVGRSPAGTGGLLYSGAG